MFTKLKLVFTTFEAKHKKMGVKKTITMITGRKRGKTVGEGVEKSEQERPKESAHHWANQA